MNKEIDNPVLYDLSINNDLLTDKTVVRMISDLACADADVGNNRLSGLPACRTPAASARGCS
jgi:hypothetical protein